MHKSYSLPRTDFRRKRHSCRSKFCIVRENFRLQRNRLCVALVGVSSSTQGFRRWSNHANAPSHYIRLTRFLSSKFHDVTDAGRMFEYKKSIVSLVRDRTCL